MSTSTFCRTCGRGGLISSVPLIHRSEVSSETVLHMMEYGIGLKVSSDDGYPQQVCRMCYGQILMSYELKRASVESQTCFLQLFPLITVVQAGEDLPSVDLELRSLDQAVKVEPEDAPIVTTEIQETLEHEDQNTLETNETRIEEIVQATTLDTNDASTITETRESDVEETIEYDHLASFLHHEQWKLRTYTCKYCAYQTFERKDYIDHYSVHPEALLCPCGFVSNRRWSLRRHLGKSRCEEKYGKQINIKPPKSRKDKNVAHTSDTQSKSTAEAMSSTSENPLVNEVPVNEGEYSKSQNSIATLASPDGTDKEDPPIDDSYLTIESVKVEPEEIISVKQSRSKPSDNSGQKRKKYICTHCPFSSYQRTRYLYHLKIHQRLLRCVCGYSTDRRFSLRRHQANRRCEKVDELAPKERRRDRIREHRKVYARSYLTPKTTHQQALRCVCGFETKRKYNLQRHLAIYSCEETYGEKVIWPSKQERLSDKNEPNDATTDSSSVIIDEMCSTTEAVLSENTQPELSEHQEEKVDLENV